MNDSTLVTLNYKGNIITYRANTPTTPTQSIHLKGIAIAVGCFIHNADHQKQKRNRIALVNNTEIEFDADHPKKIWFVSADKQKSDEDPALYSALTTAIRMTQAALALPVSEWADSCATCKMNGKECPCHAATKEAA